MAGDCVMERNVWVDAPDDGKDKKKPGQYDVRNKEDGKDDKDIKEDK